MPNEHDIAVFLLGVALLLGVARVLGDLARRARFPAVAGELAAGVLLGPTVLGRVAPGASAALFPRGAPGNMLSGFTLLSSILLLTLAGLEVDLSVVLRRRRQAVLTSAAGVALPMVLGLALGLALPGRYLLEPSQRWLFALFVGTALSISAMPVIAKTLLDLGLFRTNLGLLVMAAAMVDDVLGWLLFSLLVGPMHGHRAGWDAFAIRLGAVAAFVAAMLVVGRPLFDRALAAVSRDRMSAPGRVLSLLIVTSLLAATATQAIGIHAVFGAFLVGVVAGDSPRLRAETRAHVHEFVGNVFAPVFFAAAGLRVDFIGSFDPLLVSAVVAVACVAKVLGCSLGARAGGLSWRESWAVGFGMNSRGAMEIILALVAIEAGLIRPELFVALVMMALVTSLLSGPAMTALLRERRSGHDVQVLAEEGVVLLGLRARTAEQAIRELAQALAAGTALDGGALADAAIDQGAREAAALSDGVALPHARVDGIPRPMLALGRSDAGLDFDAPDGRPARLVALLLVPARGDAPLSALHAAVVAALGPAPRRAALLAAQNRAEVLEALREPHAPSAPAVALA